MKYLSEFVNGGIDGSITTFVVLTSSIGMKLDPKYVLTLSIANALADSISMTYARYLSAVTEYEQGILGNGRTPYTAAISVFISFFMASMMPIFMFYMIKDKENHEKMYIYIYISCIISLFFIGYIKGIVLKQNKIDVATSTAFIGGISSYLAYIISSKLPSMLR